MKNQKKDGVEVVSSQRKYRDKLQRNRTIGAVMILIGIALAIYAFKDQIMSVQNTIADNCIHSGGSYLGGHCIHK